MRRLIVGSEDSPKDGAILDLSRSGKKLGLILPNVSLNNVSDWQLDEGTGADAAGTVVFNTNAGLKNALGTTILGQGIFVWNGNGWQATKGGTGEVLATNFILTSGGSTVTDGSTVDIWTGETKPFAVDPSSFEPTSAEVAKGVKWAISPASIAAIKAGSTNTVCEVEGLTGGVATLTVTSLDNNVTKTVTINVLPVSLQSFTLSGTPLNLTIGVAASTVTANTFVGSDGQPFSGTPSVTWTETGNPGGNTVVKTGTTYQVTPDGSPASWTVVASAGGIDQSFTVSVIVWLPMLQSGAARNYSDGKAGNQAETWYNANDSTLSGFAYNSYQTSGVAPVTGKDLMVSNYVYSNNAQVKSTTAGTNNLTAADLSSLSDGITWVDAVKKCANLQEGGYNDWYLPNIMELDALYLANLLGYADINAPQRKNVLYWSSTERYAQNAWYRTFDNNKTTSSVGNYGKKVPIYMESTWVARCVRRTN